MRPLGPSGFRCLPPKDALLFAVVVIAVASSVAFVGISLQSIDEGYGRAGDANQSRMGEDEVLPDVSDERCLDRPSPKPPAQTQESRRQS